MSGKSRDQWAKELLTSTLALAWHASDPQTRKVADAAAVQVERLQAAKTKAEEAELAAAQELDEVKAKADRLQLEAEASAQEARTQRATVHEIYQVVTKGTGEPGDWHGAGPVRALMDQYDALAAHNVRLIEAGNALRAELAFWQGSDHAPRSQAARDRWTFAAEEAPATSLARLKAHWQAEVLEGFGFDCRDNAHAAADNGHPKAADGMADAADSAFEEADRLRKQAEGGDA
ncbi:hypothetical protein [Halomonas lysinitropha]|uniref:Uncharacterized protein n=1 Tax=Halomonas lysinitropha TaxID=2607506 RepID=A0A5K1I8C9_9GAMM|nr:hypothetical protein [Halomonas lysinitropha]VVZ96457.1 hypothetical protein HALO32_02557 [Halomonas lysinitropha]